MKTTITLMAAVILFFATVFHLHAQSPTGEEILARIDDNMSSDSRIVSSKMVIHSRRSSRTIQSKSWMEGEKKAFTEYLFPARERGTKMLKLEDKLWMYSPSTDRTIHISGHMLRQSVMGSDLSYEDMMEDPKLTNHYIAEVTGEETIDGHECWVIGLTAKTRDIAYHKRRLWVDKQKYIPLKQELYAKSGKLLKRMKLEDIARIKDRWYPKKMTFKDMLKTGKGTEFLVGTIEFDIDIPDHIFSKAALRK
ncbi:outer membrane lipoprotein-sorting protein [Thermodesulfobacteriota bacterium]